MDNELTYTLDVNFPADPSFKFGEVSWLVFNPVQHNLLVLQRSQPAVTFWTPAGQLVDQWTTNELGDPHSIKLQTAADGSQTVWITDMAPPLLAGSGYGHCLKQFTLQGELINVIGACGENSQGTGLDPVQFDKVTDVAFDSEGKMYVTDGDEGGLNNRTLQLDASGNLLQFWGAPNNGSGSGPKEFNLPHTVAMDDCDNAWVTDTLNNRVQVIAKNGDFIGEIACFGETQTHDTAILRLDPDWIRVFITTGLPNTPQAGSVNKVNVFDFELSWVNSTRLALSPDALAASWDITLPATSQTAMAHAITVDPQTQDVYLALLGGNLLPQKWVRN